MQLFVDSTCAPTRQEFVAAFESASVTVPDDEVDMAFLHENRLPAQRGTPPPSDRETRHEA
jgi:hypothetical protein